MAFVNAACSFFFRFRPTTTGSESLLGGGSLLRRYEGSGKEQSSVMDDAESLTAALHRHRAALRTVETRVSTADGRQFTEQRSPDGAYSFCPNVASCNSSLPFGFIVDEQPDLEVGEVLDNLIFGSQDAATDRERLLARGVTHILNVATCVPNAFPSDFVYKNWELLDVPEARLVGTELTDACKFIDEGRRSGCVLVHCNAGVSRSAAVVVAYVMRTNGWSFEKALELVRQKRPRARPNRGFTQQLIAMEKQLQFAE